MTVLQRARRARLSLIASILAAATAAHAAPPRAGGSSPKTACLAAHEEGQALRAQQKPRAAREKFVACARTECPLIVRQECAEQVTLADRDVPTIVLEARDTTGANVFAVTVSLDGARIADGLNGAAIDVEPGEHELRFERAEGKPSTERVLVLEGEKNRKIVATFEAASAPATPPAPPSDNALPRARPLPASSVVLGAVAVVSLGGFVYFAASGKSNQNDLAASCGPHCTDDEVRPVERSYLAADITLALGVVAAVAAVVLAWPAIRGAPPAPVNQTAAPWLPHSIVRSSP